MSALTFAAAATAQTYPHTKHYSCRTEKIKIADTDIAGLSSNPVSSRLTAVYRNADTVNITVYDKAGQPHPSPDFVRHDKIFVLGNVGSGHYSTWEVQGDTGRLILSDRIRNGPARYIETCCLHKKP